MFDLNLLWFVILPGNPPPRFSNQNLYDKAYQHYKSVWERTFTRRIGPAGYDAYSFFRQDFVMLLMHGNEIAGQLCSSFINLNSAIARDLSYLQNFQGAGIEALAGRNCQTFATLEYSSIDPKFSQRQVGMCLNDFVNVLGAKYVFSQGADAAGGLPRRLTGTNQKVLDAGYVKVSEQRQRLGLTVDVVLGFKGQISFSGEKVLSDHLNSIWLNRSDLTIRQSLELANNQEQQHEFDRVGIF